MPNIYNKKENSFKAPIVLKSGFPVLDTLNGSILQTKQGNRIYTGFDGGRIIGIVGKASTGKTTLASQLAYGLIKNYENGFIQIADFEGSNSIQSIQRWSGLYAEDIGQKFEILTSIGHKNNDDEERDPLTIQSLFTLVKRMRDLKVENKSILMHLDEYGTPYYEPSVILIDSIAAARGDNEVDEKSEELGTSTAVTRRAQFIKQFLTSALPLMEEANIYIIYINHINDMISISGMPQPAQLRDLKNSEAIPGGKGLLYLTNVLIKLTIKEKMSAEKDAYGIDASITEALLLKSRSAETGKSRDLVFVPTKGYLNELTSFVNLNKLKLIEGVSKHSIPGWPNTFAKKELMGLIEDPKFASLLNEYAQNALEALIPLNPVRRSEEELVDQVAGTILNDVAELVEEEEKKKKK